MLTRSTSGLMGNPFFSLNPEIPPNDHSPAAVVARAVPQLHALIISAIRRSAAVDRLQALELASVATAAMWTLGHLLICHGPVLGFAADWPPFLLCHYVLTSVFLRTLRFRFRSTASLYSGTLHPETEPKTRQPTVVSSQWLSCPGFNRHSITVRPLPSVGVPNSLVMCSASILCLPS
jgi:hypothetical protein